MFFNVLITLLVLTLVLNDRRYVFCTDKNKIADTLNTLLESSGWRNISNLEVRLPDTKNNSYSVSNLLYRNIVESNKIVNDNNYTQKYEITIYSLSCVYANALVKFINLTKTILHIGRMEKHRLSTKKCRIKSREACGLKGKTHSTDEENERANEDDLDDYNYFDKPSSSVQSSDDFIHSWKIFNSAIKQFKKSWLMFECMSEALSFLKELLPQKYFEMYLPEISRFSSIVSSYKVTSTDVQLVLPGYIGEDDNCYEGKFRELNRKFSHFLNSAQDSDRFVNNYCTIPENDKTQIVEGKDVHKTFFQQGKRTTVEDKYRVIQQLELQIESLVNKVTHNYFKDLGFVYDFTN